MSQNISKQERLSLPQSGTNQMPNLGTPNQPNNPPPQKNTMQSDVSDMLAQNQKNLQHLYSLQSSINTVNNALNNGSNDGDGNTQQIPYYLQLKQAYNNEELNEPDNELEDGTKPINQSKGAPHSGSNNLRYNSVSSNGNGNISSNNKLSLSPSNNINRYNSMNSINNRYNSITSNNNSNSNNNNNNNSKTPTHSLTSNIQFQGKNSLTSASIKSRARSSFQRQRSKQVALSMNKNKKYDPKNPLVIIIPYSAQPTEILASRFDAWRNVIKSLITYLTETSSIQDEIVRQQLRLTHAIQFPFFSLEQHNPQGNEAKANQKFFLPLGHGSIQDLPTILNQYHGSLATNASKMSKELTNEVIPRLEYLRRDLLIKIKEIKLLESDFKNSCGKELQQTKQDMKRFQDSVEEWNNLSKVNDIAAATQTNTNKNKYQDPYITKLILDKQIKRQITEENFLHEAFDNLESSGCELEKVVVMEIQNALTIYAKLLGQQSQLVFDSLISRLDMGFFSKDPQYEWDDFIERDSNFIELDLPQRKLQMINYKNQFDPFTYEIRSGYLEKRSKFLKSYSRGYFVLTPCYLHEFKTADRKKDLVPVMSLNLIDCTITESSKKELNENKFILHEKQNGLIKRGHNWVFKGETYNIMMQWFQDLKTITQINNIADRKQYVCNRLNLDESGKPIILRHSSTHTTKGASNNTANNNHTSMKNIRVSSTASNGTVNHSKIKSPITNSTNNSAGGNYNNTTLANNRGVSNISTKAEKASITITPVTTSDNNENYNINRVSNSCSTAGNTSSNINLTTMVSNSTITNHSTPSVNAPPIPSSGDISTPSSRKYRDRTNTSTSITTNNSTNEMTTNTSTSTPNVTKTVEENYRNLEENNDSFVSVNNVLNGTIPSSSSHTTDNPSVTLGYATSGLTNASMKSTTTLEINTATSVNTNSITTSTTTNNNNLNSRSINPFIQTTISTPTTGTNENLMIDTPPTTATLNSPYQKISSSNNNSPRINTVRPTVNTNSTGNSSVSGNSGNNNNNLVNSKVPIVQQQAQLQHQAQLQQQIQKSSQHQSPNGVNNMNRSRASSANGYPANVMNASIGMNPNINHINTRSRTNSNVVSINSTTYSTTASSPVTNSSENHVNNTNISLKHKNSPNIQKINSSTSGTASLKQQPQQLQQLAPAQIIQQTLPTQQVQQLPQVPLQSPPLQKAPSIPMPQLKQTQSQSQQKQQVLQQQQQQQLSSKQNARSKIPLHNQSQHSGQHNGIHSHTSHGHTQRQPSSHGRNHKRMMSTGSSNSQTTNITMTKSNTLSQQSTNKGGNSPQQHYSYHSSQQQQQQQHSSTRLNHTNSAPSSPIAKNQSKTTGSSSKSSSNALKSFLLQKKNNKA
ncbi:hypothetical protein TBLA_0G02450 [Henningerozyma blattae CBS 6284]|uniref:PH domain-containing protein n=1 Tax=Henningerozyma blattae (strain ATCC 34711 / CBS 6284 / DSM 70876 / NBRC 10599 / NRRL Y-10934 / UCD 77-7) TaxID=1071380 RepID=I2H733_HENB6|nr:hypothetical protein TBLA_0G02450 [Tetrapisispora blattae CBS 6284]CCH62185.1 hypothetical protein TBLA_0G02450 [Tetrapisispora blattae CBS 6284]